MATDLPIAELNRANASSETVDYGVWTDHRISMTGRPGILDGLPVL